MFVKCRCGELRTVSPWRSTRLVEVKMCIVCQPRPRQIQPKPVAPEKKTLKQIAKSRSR